MNILLLDDHPIIIELYQNVLGLLFELRRPAFYKALNCKEALETIECLEQKHLEFQLAIIDHSIPPYPEKGLNNGTDVALFLKKRQPDCKLIINTALLQITLLYDIHKKVMPHGLIVKNDITIAHFEQIIEEIVNHNTYYNSPSVKKSISEIWNMEVLAEDYNRQILYYLSKGYKIKEIEEVLPLAATTIQKRIVQMKKVFNTLDNESLLKTAVSKGYI